MDINSFSSSLVFCNTKALTDRPIAFKTGTNALTDRPRSSFSSRPSLSSRRRSTLIDRPIAFGINPDFKFCEVSTAEAATQHLDELSPMAGGFGRAFTKKHRKKKKLREWNMDGRVRFVEVPFGRFKSFLEVPIEWSCPAAEPRSRFHRLIYQKARYLREEHGNVYTSFRQVGRDMVCSVRLCLQIVRNFDKLAKELMHDESENDDEARLDGASGNEISPTQDSVNYFPRDERSVEETWRELEEKFVGWKEVLADLKLFHLIIAFLD